MYQHILNKYKIIPNGIIHIGASFAEEIEHYINIGVKKLIYIEANPENMVQLTDISSRYVNRINVKVYNYAISDKNAILDFYVTDNKMSSSLFPMKTHIIHHPTIKHEKIIKVNSVTFNDFIVDNFVNINDYNILVMDIQGAELLALKGATIFLDKFQLIQTEISREEVYEGCCLHNEITEFLKKYNFEMIDYFENPNKANDDAYYILKT